MDRDRQLFRVADDIRGEREMNLRTLAEACVNRGLTVGLEDMSCLQTTLCPEARTLPFSRSRRISFLSF